MDNLVVWTIMMKKCLTWKKNDDRVIGTSPSIFTVITGYEKILWRYLFTFEH